MWENIEVLGSSELKMIKVVSTNSGISSSQSMIKQLNDMFIECVLLYLYILIFIFHAKTTTVFIAHHMFSRSSNFYNYIFIQHDEQKWEEEEEKLKSSHVIKTQKIHINWNLSFYLEISITFLSLILCWTCVD
jgi:hypothetical protein